MRAVRLAAAITLPALALLPATATAASAATYSGDGSTPITVNASGGTSPDGTTLVLDPASTSVQVSASGCTEQPSTVHWILYPNDTRMPVGDGEIAATASDGTWSTTIDVAAQVTAWKVSDPAASSWTLGVSCDGYQGQHSTALVPVLMSTDAVAGATDPTTTTTSGSAVGTTTGPATGGTATSEQVSTGTAEQARPAAAPAHRTTAATAHRRTLAHTGAAVVPVAISAVGILIVGVFLAWRARRS